MYTVRFRFKKREGTVDLEVRDAVIIDQPKSIFDTCG
jgi:hypothetical protein